MRETGFRIASAETASDLADIKALFRAYAASLSVDLAYQDFEAERATLPGKYAPPGGSLLLARDGQGRAIGCVALRPLDAAAAEMKRLYVAPEARGLGLGQALVHAVCAAARKAGYNEIRLDTLPENEERSETLPRPRFRARPGLLSNARGRHGLPRKTPAE